MKQLIKSPSIVCLMLIAFAVAAFAGCGPSSSGGSSYPTIESRAVKITNWSTATPHGAAIGLEDGVSISPAELSAIDTGIEHTIAKAKCKGYSGNDGLSNDQYAIAYVKSIPDSQGDPAYAQSCAQYCGTEWDKGGYILIAGQVLGYQDPSGNRNLIAIPAHDASRLDHLATVTGFEVEHAVLKIFDPPEYDRTKTHGTGTGHPIIPECQSANRRSLYGSQFSTPSYKGILSK